MRVLIADDETIIRLDLRGLLEQAGYEVQEARDGAEAVLLAESWQPDVVLLDVRMPVLDGVEAARRIIASRPVAVVLLTAFSSAVLWARRRAGGRLPCGCFGRPERTHDVRWLLARNLALIGLAVLAIVGGTHGTPWAGVRGPTRDDAIAVVLVACGVILLAWTAASTVRSLRVGGRR